MIFEFIINANVIEHERKQQLYFIAKRKSKRYSNLLMNKIQRKDAIKRILD